LVLLGCLSQLIPILKRNKLTWEWRKVISCWAQRQRQRNGGNGNGTARSPRKNIWCTTIVLAERLSDPYFWCLYQLVISNNEGNIIPGSDNDCSWLLLWWVETHQTSR
jgi:hypothetical protein